MPCSKPPARIQTFEGYSSKTSSLGDGLSRTMCSRRVECVFPRTCFDTSTETHDSLGPAPFGGYLRRSHRCASISPRATFVVDDVGNLVVAQRTAKRRHGSGVDHASCAGPLHSM